MLAVLLAIFLVVFLVVFRVLGRFALAVRVAFAFLVLFVAFLAFLLLAIGPPVAVDRVERQRR